MTRSNTEINKDVQELQRTVYGENGDGIKSHVIAMRNDIRWLKIIGGWVAGIFSAVLIAICVGVVKIFMKL